MADNTKIEWADATVNYVNGCSVISAGCTNCYAMRSGGRNLPNHPSTGLTVPTKAGHVWTGEVRANEKQLLQVLRWKQPSRIFWNAHGDLFHENVPHAWIDRQFAVMALTPQHTHMVLTKRPERMRAYVDGRLTNCGGTRWAADILSDAAYDIGIDEESCIALANVLNGFSWWKSMPPRDGNRLDGSSILWPLPNVWLGTSVEDQRAANERALQLRNTPAAVRFLSCEPLLEHVLIDLFKIDWVIAGGESGPGARPMDEAWARSLRDQCQAAGVAFFMKQMSGARKPLPEIPADLLIREFPNAAR